MSWLDDIVDFGSSALNWLGANPIVGSLAKTAILGYGVNQVTKSVNQESAKDKVRITEVDGGVKIQVDPDPKTKIPVVYGQAYIAGIVTDAVLTNNNQTMYFCLTLCEKTGNLNFGTGGQPSVFSFQNIYWNDERIVFKSDGITVNNTVDRTGVVNTDFDGLIKIYCYSGNIASPVVPVGYTNNALVTGELIMPGWTTYNQMSNLVFAIVRVDYNKDKNSTGLGNVVFQIENSMKKPGDCLYDYLTNTRYGAGLDPTEILTS
jgi:hypothetical protein